MALFLVQHGRSMTKEEDPEQGLSGEGIADTERIAAVAKGYGVRVSCIAHSGKKRARQTAGIFAIAFQPVRGVEERGGLNPMDDVVPIAAGLDPGEDLMLVGHLPFMERLTSHLITGSVAPPVFKFQNGGIVCLDRDPDRRPWYIKWTLMPKIS